MKKNHTDIILVLDRSGSMTSVCDATIAGVNRFLADQKAAPGTATFTLHQFDDVFETPIHANNVQYVSPLTRETFVPRGGTALLDAIGKGIDDAGRRFTAMAESDRPEKVVFVIVTDGQENQSRLYSRAKIFDMIAHQRAKYAWEFVYLGANQDAIATFTAVGGVAANAMTYAHNAVGTQSAFGSLAKNTVMFRAGGKASMSYEAVDYAAQAAAGVTQNAP